MLQSFDLEKNTFGLCMQSFGLENISLVCVAIFWPGEIHFWFVYAIFWAGIYNFVWCKQYFGHRIVVFSDIVGQTQKLNIEHMLMYLICEENIVKL